MKPKPAVLLTALTVASVVFISYLLKQAGQEDVCCREKAPFAAPVKKGLQKSELPTVQHLIASTM